MGWITELSAVYDAVMRNSDDDKPLPLYHIENNAPLIITLDGNGNFLSARLLEKSEKSDWQTCMPCTEKSAARTSGAEAYPFCDKLEYVAGDYGKYANGKNLEEKHTKYLALLEKWAKSEYANQKIKSVFAYVKKESVVADILCVGIPAMQDNKGIEENNVFVKWEVEIPEDDKPRTWRDQEIHQLWIQFYENCYLTNTSFCYISGKESPIAELHPAKIRNAGDSAKIISSNDSANYTFRGRFEKAEQACQIGIEITTQAHNALRWLITKQGTTVGNGLTVVSWCTATDIKPIIMSNSLGFGDDDFENDNKEEVVYSTAEDFAHALNNRLRGYYGDVSNSDKIFVMELNAATPGRMSILLYREFSKSDFCDAQEFWHTHLAWFYSYWKAKKSKDEKSQLMRTISAPSPIEIAKTAYGEHLNDNVKTMAIQRLLSCILDKTPIPLDIERLCFNNASRLITLEEGVREKTLETACAVIKYNLYVRKKEDYNVGLEEDRTTRDYLFGRLLAVADRVESAVLADRGESRESNAVRYMQQFAKYPRSTWKILYVDKLQPYLKHLNQLNPKLRDWYEGIIQDISSKFEYDEFDSDEALSGVFLLGYHCQQKDFWRKRNKEQPLNTETQIKEEE
jgi:CRISPR-associated protein Csd1